MASLVHGYPELPIYGPETVLHDPREVLKLGLTSDTFVREVTARSTFATTLGEVLRITEEGLGELANDLGVIAVWHQFGYHPVDGPPRETHKYDVDTPPGMILVAEVEIVKPLGSEDTLAAPTDAQIRQITRGIGRYWARHRGEPVLSDLGWNQCAPGRSSRGEGLHYLDVEPRINR